MKKSARQKKLRRVKEGAIKKTADEIIQAVATVTAKDEDKLWRELMTDPKQFAKDYAKYLSAGQRKFLGTESAQSLKTVLKEST